MGVNPLKRAVFLLAALISGCGGGSDGAGPSWNGTQSPSTEASPQVTPKADPVSGSGSALRPLARSPSHLANRFPNAQKYSYKLGAGSIDNPSTTLTTLNSPAYAGYRIFGYFTLDGNEPAIIYEKGVVDAYSYRTSSGSAFDEGTLITQAAAGYVAMGGFLTPGGGSVTLHGKPQTGGTSGTTYDYIRLQYDVFANVPSSAFTTQLNSAGSQGGCSIEGGAGTSTLLLRRSHPLAGVCRYEILPLAATSQAHIDQLNAQGARGFIPSFRGPFDGEGAKQVYVKDTSQNSTFGYYVLDTPGSLTRTMTGRANAFVDWLNREGEKGGRSFESYVEGGVRKTIFRMSENCIGFPCD